MCVIFVCVNKKIKENIDREAKKQRQTDRYMKKCVKTETDS